MTKFAIMIVPALGLIASLMIYRNFRDEFRGRETLLRQRDEQLTALLAEQRRLSNLLANATNASPEDHAVELAKLRGDAEALKKQTNELSRQLTARRQSPLTPPVTENHPQEYWERLHEMAGGKVAEAGALSRAFWAYAWDHQGRCPTAFDQFTFYLATEHQTLSGTNQFEIVYQGSLSQLDGVPTEQVAVIRDPQTWTGPDGRPARVYGVGGSAYSVSSDDNFQSWEAQHIISPPRAGRSGKN